MSLAATICTLVGLSLLGAVVGCMIVLTVAKRQEKER